MPPLEPKVEIKRGHSDSRKRSLIYSPTNLSPVFLFGICSARLEENRKIANRKIAPSHGAVWAILLSRAQTPAHAETGRDPAPLGVYGKKRRRSSVG